MITNRRNRFRFIVGLIAIPFVLLFWVSQTMAQDDSGPTPEPIYSEAGSALTGTVGISWTVPATPTIVVPPTVVVPPTIAPTETPLSTETPAPTAVPPTETAVPTIVSTETPLPTEEPTTSPAEEIDYGRDDYEPDSAESPALWTGTVRREFAPAADVDYVLYFIKPGQTTIQTKDLTGAADTVLEVWSGDEFLATDDDSGEGLASLIRLDSDSEKQVVIIIRNKAVGFGRGVGYTLEIVPQALFTPTPTLRATSTPIPQQPTATPFVITATPAPTAEPTVSLPVVRGPLPTATPSMEFVLRVDVFIDADRDGELDAGEGIDGIFIEARTLDTKVSFSGYTQNGIAIIEVICPPGSHSPFSQLEVLAPYLQRSKFLDINQNENTFITNFALEAAVLPIALP